MRELHAAVVELARLLIVVALATASIAACAGGDGAAPTSTTRLPTRDDYAQAVAEAVQCLQDLGFTASSFEQADGSFALSVGTPDGDAGGNSDRIDAAYDQCTDRYLNDVQLAYLASIQPSEEEAREIPLQCLLDAGLIDSIDLSDEETLILDQELAEDPTYLECRDLPFENPDFTQGGRADPDLSPGG